jgi:hypothetical protein
MAVKEALGVGAQRAHAASKGVDEGHLPMWQVNYGISA